MNTDEVNARTAELLGYRWVISDPCNLYPPRCRRLLPVREGDVVEVWDGEEDIGTCDNDGLDMVPDYCNGLNATMAVIRERWPDAEIRLSSNMVYIEFWEDTILEPAKGYGDTDAERLARALLAALEETKSGATRGSA